MFPIPSTSVSSLSVWRIPSFKISVDATIPFTTNETSTSLTVELPVTVSPSVNVPTTLSSSNSVTETAACWLTMVLITTAVAPEVWPVIIAFSISWPSKSE